MREFTVNEVSRMAGVSRRTLHYYDQIDLLKPSRIGGNRYRYYNQASILRLQQVMFYRELGLPLEDIRRIMTSESYDELAALQTHRTQLSREQQRLSALIHTIDETIKHIKGERTMTENELFKGFSEEQQAEFAEEARQRWDRELVEISNQRWGSYSPAKKEQVMKEGEEITLRFRDSMPKGFDSLEAQQAVQDWRDYIGNFYDCSLEILQGLGQMYVDDARFRASYEKVAPGLAEFIRDAINYYVEQKG